MKLTVIGGGGFRTPYIFEALASGTEPLVDELALLDPSRERLDAMSAVLAGLAIGKPFPPRVTLTTDPHAAIAGSDVVFSAVRVGGLEGRRTDERVASELGVLGQETTGPGGIAYSLRTVPVMVEYAHLIADLAPHAWVLNFTNPAGIITEAMQAVLGERVIGVCDTPSSLVRRVCQIAGVDPLEVVPDYVGLNHLGWLRGLQHAGRDILPALIADDAALARLDEATIFGVEWIRALGAIPNEYLYYYYLNREAVQTAATRGDHLATTQNALFSAISDHPDQALSLWRDAVQERNQTYMSHARGDHPESAPRVSDADLFIEGYAAVAVGVVRAILQDEPAVAILNVRNGDTVAQLPPDAVIEVPCRVTAAGPEPVPITPPNLHQCGLIQQVKHVERLAIHAALTGDALAALSAFGLHPLVDSFSVANQLLDTYLAEQPELRGVLPRGRC